MQIAMDNNAVFYATGNRDPEPGRPVMIFIHGVALDNTVWTLYARYYARRGYNVYAMDLPGHGRSTGKPLTSVAAMAEWLAGFMDALGLDSATLVGHSLGGLVALETAARYPARVGCLALLGVAMPMPVAPQLLEAARNNQQAAIDMLILSGVSYRAQLGGNPLAGLSVVGHGRRLMERCADGVILSGLQACNEYTPDAAHLQKVACPVSLIAGHDDVMTPLQRTMQLAQQLPAARLLNIPGCGHMLMAERPEEVHIALLEVVEERQAKARNTPSV